MRNWRRKVNVHSILDKVRPTLTNEPEHDNKIAKEAGKKIAEELRCLFSLSQDFEELAERLELDVFCVETLDEVLVDLYDAADHHNVWLGMPAF